MTEPSPCPLCRHTNPLGNRFCGSCGTPLTSGEQLATRQDHHPVPTSRAWPAKLGPAGKVLAVGVAALAAEVGLSWLQRKIGTEDRSSARAVRGADSASRGYGLGQSVEGVFVRAWEEDSHSWVFLRQEVRRFFTTEPAYRQR